MSLRPGAEHAIELWKKLPGSASQLKSSLDLYNEVFSRVCDRKKAKHLVAVEKKFNKMFENSDVKSIGTKDLRQMIELKHTKCKARPLRKDFDQGNPEAKVQSVTEKAFQEVRRGDWEAGIKTLSELYCVGPATATSILSFVDPLGTIHILRKHFFLPTATFSRIFLLIYVLKIFRLQHENFVKM